MPTPPRRTAILAALLVATVVPATSLGAEPITPAAPATPAATAPAKFEFEQFQLVLLLRPADRKELPEAEAETWYVGKGYMTFPKAPAPAASP
jgi:hypothetical protein